MPIQYHRILLFLLLSCLLMPIHAQENNDNIGVTITSEAVSDGYILFSTMQANTAYLIDNDGYIVNQWENDAPMLAVYLLENGDLLATTLQDRGDFPAGTTGRIVRFDWDNNLLWSYDFDQPDAQIHHDITLRPNGNILMTMWETVPPTEFADWGLDPALVPDDDSSLLYDRIIELDPQTNEIVWEWRVLDHSVQDYDDSLPNYGIPAANPHLIDLNYSHRMPDVRDRTHFNGIEYNADLDQILLSAHFHSEIWIIDYETGNLVYRWGNPQAYGRGLTADRQLFNQHNPRWLDNGNILIFNNGSDNFRRFSTVVEIVPPLNADHSYTLLEGSAFSPLEPIWEYRAEPQESLFARNISGAQRLPNGNTFITDGPNGRLFEIDAEGEILWEYRVPIFMNNDPTRHATVFRATRYLPDDPALHNRDLTATSEIEIQFFVQE